ncbi:hypothetical protein ACWGNE_17675 [Streptomyces xiamenensis]
MSAEQPQELGNKIGHGDLRVGVEHAVHSMARYRIDDGQGQPHCSLSEWWGIRS